MLLMTESQIQVKVNPDSLPSGSDLTCVNAARRSFNTRSDWNYHSNGEVYGDGTLVEYVSLKEKDKRLIQFLARGMTADDFESFCGEVECLGEEEYTEKLKEMLWQWRNTPTHDTPFNHCFISFEVKAPIFVARQLVKHEYLIMSEFSRRYITDDIEFYEPDYWRKASPDKKQGSLKESVETPDWLWIVDSSDNSTLQSETLDIYTYMVNTLKVAPEQARMVLPQSTMTEWTWSGTLGAFAKMCQLRLHPEAQYEARLVAQQVYDYLKIYYPVSAKALVEGVDV
jgi:thymidylate synthase (FAD)